MTKHPHDVVALTVVRFLGIGALIGLLVTGFLVYRAQNYEGDPATVALIGSVSSLASLFAGSLAAILASTGKGAPQAVEVVNTLNDPVPTEDAGYTAPDLLLVLTFVGVVLLLCGVTLR